MQDVRSSRGRVALAFVLVTSVSTALAETPPSAPAPSDRPTVIPTAVGRTDIPEPTVPPHLAGGLVIDGHEEPGWRVAARAALWPVRGVWSLVMAPPRAGMWVNDRYQLTGRLQRIFFNDAGTFGLYPTAGIETGFGPNVGARLVADELVPGGRLRARAGWGGTYAHVVSARLDSGALLGARTAVALDASYEAFSRARFFGIGGGDLAPAPPMLIDPRVDDTAVSTRYRHDDTTAALTSTLRAASGVAFRLRTVYRHARFDGAIDTRGDSEIGAAYDPAALVGFDGLDTLAGELEIAIDTRRTVAFGQSPGLPSVGWRVRAFAGGSHELGDGPGTYPRWGADATHLFDLGDGQRVLAIRAVIEGVLGELEDVPFLDLPRLGGPHALRGYERDRFRDRNAALASAEYAWAAEKHVAGFIFVDAGRVGRELDDALALDLDTLRIGYGGGLQLHGDTGFLARAVLATSIDGGFQVFVTFTPTSETRIREEIP